MVSKSFRCCKSKIIQLLSKTFHISKEIIFDKAMGPMNRVRYRLSVIMLYVETYKSCFNSLKKIINLSNKINNYLIRNIQITKI